MPFLTPRELEGRDLEPGDLLLVLVRLATSTPGLSLKGGKAMFIQGLLL